MIMELKDYTTEELKAELKRRNDLAKVEKEKIKRCRMCKHWGEVNCFGNPNYDILCSRNKCCKFFKNSTGKYYKTHKAYQLACEHFEERI